MATAAHPDFNLDVLLYREDGQWVAHCLQLDLVEAGATPEEAEEALAVVIQHHIQWAIEDDDMEHLLPPRATGNLEAFLHCGAQRDPRDPAHLAREPDRRTAGREGSTRHRTSRRVKYREALQRARRFGVVEDPRRGKG